MKTEAPDTSNGKTRGKSPRRRSASPRDEALRHNAPQTALAAAGPRTSSAVGSSLDDDCTRSDAQTESDTVERSELAAELADLKQRTVAAAGKRTRLPQPLFWSLFHSRIQKIKRTKSERRLLSDLLG